jgi:hypothetical protein
MSDFLSNLFETTNLLLVTGFGVVILLMWFLLLGCVRIVDNLEHIIHINDSLNEINQRLRRKGFYKDKQEEEYDGIMGRD